VFQYDRGKLASDSKQQVADLFIGFVQTTLLDDLKEGISDGLVLQQVAGCTFFESEARTERLKLFVRFRVHSVF